MRDTFSRKFARRILKPRGKQDQYRLADGGRRQRTISSACPFGWLPARILPSFLPFLPPLLPKGWRGWFEDILGNGKEDEGVVYLAWRQKAEPPLLFLTPPPSSRIFLASLSLLTHFRCELVSESFDREFSGPCSISLFFLWRWRNSWCRVCPSSDGARELAVREK